MYFAKWVPVKGEIKEGDNTFYKGSNVAFPVILNEYTTIEYFNKGDHKKVKLFLCTRDIQVGDKFDSANGTGFVCTRLDEYNLYSIGGLHSDIEEVSHSRIYSFKVIGEISPEATWVKHGDEWSAEDLKPFYTGKLAALPVYEDGIAFFGSARQMNYVAIGIPPKSYFIKVKGPCGHFH